MPEVGEKRNFKMLTQEWDGKRWVNVKREKPTAPRGGRGGSGRAEIKPDESRGAGHTKNFSGGYTADQVNQEFRQTFGRDATQDEIDNWTKWGKGVGQISAEIGYKSKNTIEIYTKDGERVDAGTKGATKYVIHKDEDEFYKYYGTDANRMRFEEHNQNIVHLAPGQALQGIGKGSYEFNSSQVTEDSSFFNFLKQQGLDPNQYYVGQGVHKSANFLSQDLFTSLSDLTGIKEIDELGELVFDKWMPDELKFIADPLGTYGNFLDEDWNAQGLEAMSDTFGGDVEDWQKGQAYANVAVDIVATIMTAGAYGAVTAAKLGMTTGRLALANATRMTLRRANQIIGAGGEGADDFLIDTAAQVASSFVPGGAVARTTASFAFQTAANKAKGMDWGDSAEEAAWSTVSSRTGGVSNLIRAGVDEDYRDQLEENPNGWAMFALQTAAGAYAFGQNVQQTYGDQGAASWGKAIAAGFGYGEKYANGDYGWDLRFGPPRGSYTQGISAGTSLIPGAVNQQDYTVGPGQKIGWTTQQSGFDAFKSHMGNTARGYAQSFVDAFTLSTPFSLLRGPVKSLISSTGGTAQQRPSTFNTSGMDTTFDYFSPRSATGAAATGMGNVRGSFLDKETMESALSKSVKEDLRGLGASF